MLGPSLPGAAPAPAGAASPWHELPGAVTPGAAAWPPRAFTASPPQALLVEPAGAADLEPEMPSRLFDEAELTQLTAAAAAAAGLEARRAAEAGVAAREVALLEELTAQLTREREARCQADRAARHQLTLVAGAIARAFAADERWNGDRALAAVAAMLDGLPEIAAARLLVDPATAAALEGRLPELARRAGFPITLETVEHAGRPPGAVQLLWNDGWAEHDPTELGRQIEGLLTVYGMPQRPTENCEESEEMHQPEGAAL